MRPYVITAHHAPALKLLIGKFLLFAIVALFCGCSPKITDKVRAQVIQDGHQQLEDYHAASWRKSEEVVKVVYFYGADSEPMANWEQRMNRTLNDISKFYQHEFAKYGVRINGVPFEKKGRNIVFHLIRGQYPTQHYQLNSWTEIEKEIALSTAGNINFVTGYTLVINALAKKTGPFKYNFHSPYFGHWGSYFSNRGDCWVADCEVLDVKQLSNTRQKMEYSESMVSNKICTIAEFNSWYIGGIAHEMGHMLGLIHDYGGDNELQPDQISLMGEYGSRHYRDYVWKGKPSSTLSAAGVFQLINHPLFRNQIKIDSPDAGTTEIINNYDFRNKHHRVLGSVKLGRPIYGVVVLLRPVNQSEYLSKSYMATVTDQKFDLDLGVLPANNYWASIFLLSKSGKINYIDEVIRVDNSQGINKMMPHNGEINLATFYEHLKQITNLKHREEKLAVLQSLTDPVKPINISTNTGNRIELANAEWIFAQVGWGRIARNYFSLEDEPTVFLENKGEFFKTGLYAHAPSDYVFDLNGKWKKFIAKVGLRDGAAAGTGIKFSVWGDGKKLYETVTLAPDQQENMIVNIENVKQLSLRAMYTGPDNSHAWAVWLSPVIER